jgi:molybdenum cofactor biosynthesis enzyme
MVVVDMEEDFELLVKLPEDNKGEVQYTAKISGLYYLKDMHRVMNYH